MPMNKKNKNKQKYKKETKTNKVFIQNAS